MSKFQEILDSEYCCESNEISELLLETYNIDIELVSEGFVDSAKNVVNKIWEAFLKFIKKVRDFFMKMFEKVKKHFAKDKKIIVDYVVPVENWESIAKQIVDWSIHGIESFVETDYCVRRIERKNLQSDEILKELKDSRWLNEGLTNVSFYNGIPMIIYTNRLSSIQVTVDDKFYKHVDGLVKELTRYGRQFYVIRETAPSIIEWCKSVFIDVPKSDPTYKEQLGYFISSVQHIVVKRYCDIVIRVMSELTHDAKRVLKAISDAR